MNEYLQTIFNKLLTINIQIMWVKLIKTTNISVVNGDYNIQRNNIIKEVTLKEFDSYLELAKYVNNKTDIDFKIIK